MIKKRLKRLISFVCTMSIITSLSMTTFASETTKNDTLKTAYNNIEKFSNKTGIDLNMEFEDFVSNYNGQSISIYENSYYEVLSIPSAEPYSSSGGKKYYYNTGQSCPSSAKYNTYNLLNVVRKGDIIYEAKGGFGITGHIAIVEGIFESKGKKYIRLIEAIDVGVVRSILDDTRVKDKGVTILRVSSATIKQVKWAVIFCINQLGKPYNLDLAKDKSASEKDWYCSELVWAAYKVQGINIEVSGGGEPGVTPRDIKNSSKTEKISYT